MLPASGRQHRGCIIPHYNTLYHIIPHYNTQSSAPEDGQNNFPKHVELTGIIIIFVASSWLSILFILHYIFLRLAKQSKFNPYPENVENMVSS